MQSDQHTNNQGTIHVEEEKMELGHEAVPGYKKIFFIAITVASLYLLIILINTL